MNGGGEVGDVVFDAVGDSHTRITRDAVDACRGGTGRPLTISRVICKFNPAFWTTLWNCNNEPTRKQPRFCSLPAYIYVYLIMLAAQKATY